jgi:16S rRNA (guanine966-N2)-methyltransferase
LAKQLPETKFSIIFVDPPYRKGLSATMLQEIENTKILTSDALVVVEEETIADLPSMVTELNLVDQRRYGASGFWFYRRISSENNSI